MNLKKIATGILSAVIMAVSVPTGASAISMGGSIGWGGYGTFDIGEYSYTCFGSFDSNGNASFHSTAEVSYHGNETEITIPDTLVIPETVTTADGEIYNVENHGEELKITAVASVGDKVEKVTLGKNFADFDLFEFESPYWGDFEGKSLKNIVIENNDNVVTDGAAIYSKDMTFLLAVAGGIETYTLPKTVTRMGYSVPMEYREAFANNNVNTAYYVEEGSEAYASVDGVLFNKDKTVLVRYPSQKSGKEYTVPNGVRSIADYAFCNNSLETINLSNSVLNVNRAFLGCKSLSKVTVPSRLTRFIYWAGRLIMSGGYRGDFSFEDCSSDLTICGVKESGAEAYVEYYNENSGDLPKHKFSVLKNIILEDKATNIMVEGDLDEKVSLKVEVKTETDDLHSYNITLVGSDGSEVQPKDSGVIVKIPVPEGFRYVYRVEADGTYTDMWAQYTNSSDGAYVEFFTDHFSAYIVSDKELASPPATTPDDENSDNSNNSDDTSEDDTSGTSSDISDSTDSIDSTDNSGNTNTNPSTGIAIALVPTILAGAAVTVIIRKRK